MIEVTVEMEGVKASYKDDIAVCHGDEIPKRIDAIFNNVMSLLIRTRRINPPVEES